MIVFSLFGLRKEEYIEVMNKDGKEYEWNEDDESLFNISLEEMTIPEDSIFVLGDSWWRSKDSLTFGALSMDKVIGVVVGTTKTPE